MSVENASQRLHRGGFRGLLSEFCDDTSNVGFYRMGDNRRRIVARVFWALLFLVCLVAFVINMVVLVNKYLEYPVYVDTSIKFKTLPYPAVTICNTNPFTRTQIDNSETELANYQDGFYHMLTKAGFFKKGNLSDENDIGETCSGTNSDALDVLCHGMSVCDESGEDCRDYDNFNYDDYYHEEDEEDTEDTFDDVTTENYLNSLPSRKRKREAGGPLQDGGNPPGDGASGPLPMGGGGHHKKKRNGLGLMQLISKSVRDMIFLLHQPDKQHARDELYNNHTQFKNSFIKECSYNLKRCGPDDFKQIETDYFGTCYSFNYDGAKGNTTKPGALFGLRLLIDVDQDEYLYTTDAAGVKVAIHNPYHYPFPETSGYNAMVSASTSIRMKMIEMIRLSQPYGNCVNQKEKRNISYDYQGNYTMDGCFYTCISRRIIEKCGCGHYMYSLPEAAKMNGATYSFCGKKNRTCAEREEKTLLDDSTFTPQTCGCFDLCKDSSYRTTVSQTSYPSKQFLSQMKEEGSLEEPETSLVQLEVFYETLNYQKYEEKAEYGIIQLISDFGGQIGLWLGVCVLSMVEFLSLFTSSFLLLFGCIRQDIEFKDTKKPEPHGRRAVRVRGRSGKQRIRSTVSRRFSRKLSTPTA